MLLFVLLFFVLLLLLLLLLLSLLFWGRRVLRLVLSSLKLTQLQEQTNTTTMKKEDIAEQKQQRLTCTLEPRPNIWYTRAIIFTHGISTRVRSSPSCNIVFPSSWSNKINLAGNPGETKSMLQVSYTDMQTNGLKKSLTMERHPSLHKYAKGPRTHRSCRRDSPSKEAALLVI